MLTTEQINEMIEIARNKGANPDSLAKMQLALHFFCTPEIREAVTEEIRVRAEEIIKSENNQ